MISIDFLGGSFNVPRLRTIVSIRDTLTLRSVEQGLAAAAVQQVSLGPRH